MLYVNGLLKALLSTNAYLFADRTNILYQQKNVLNISDWFLDYKLSTRFVKLKLNAIFQFVSKLLDFNMTYNNNRTEQNHQLEYLEANVSGESMAIKSLRTISTNLQFLHRQNQFLNLNPQLRRLLCNSLIQKHFDYV